jgi:hypothetical protein
VLFSNFIAKQSNSSIGSLFFGIVVNALILTDKLVGFSSLNSNQLKALMISVMLR